MLGITAEIMLSIRMNEDFRSSSLKGIFLSRLGVDALTALATGAEICGGLGGFDSLI